MRTASIRGTVTITTLKQEARVGRAVNLLEGRHRSLEPGASLWIFVYSLVAQRFYPQSQPAVLTGDRYRSAAFFGGQVGEHYEVVAVLATPTASRFLASVLDDWNRTGDFQGLQVDRLPAGLQEKACVAVRLGG